MAHHTWLLVSSCAWLAACGSKNPETTKDLRTGVTAVKAVTPAAGDARAETAAMPAVARTDPIAPVASRQVPASAASPAAEPKLAPTTGVFYVDAAKLSGFDVETIELSLVGSSGPTIKQTISVLGVPTAVTLPLDKYTATFTLLSHASKVLLSGSAAVPVEPEASAWAVQLDVPGFPKDTAVSAVVARIKDLTLRERPVNATPPNSATFDFVDAIGRAVGNYGTLGVGQCLALHVRYHDQTHGALPLDAATVVTFSSTNLIAGSGYTDASAQVHARSDCSDAPVATLPMALGAADLVVFVQLTAPGYVRLIATAAAPAFPANTAAGLGLYVVDKYLSLEGKLFEGAGPGIALDYGVCYPVTVHARDIAQQPVVLAAPLAVAVNGVLAHQTPGCKDPPSTTVTIAAGASAQAFFVTAVQTASAAGSVLAASAADRNVVRTQQWPLTVSGPLLVFTAPGGGAQIADVGTIHAGVCTPVSLAARSRQSGGGADTPLTLAVPAFVALTAAEFGGQGSPLTVALFSDSGCTASIVNAVIAAQTDAVTNYVLVSGAASQRIVLSAADGDQALLAATATAIYTVP